MRLALGLGLPYGGEAGVGVPGGSPASKALIDETDGLALSFVDDYFLSSTGHYGSARVKDTSTPANNYNSHPFGLLTYDGVPKELRGSDGETYESDPEVELPYEWDAELDDDGNRPLLGIKLQEGETLKLSLSAFPWGSRGTYEVDGVGTDATIVGAYLIITPREGETYIRSIKWVPDDAVQESLWDLGFGLFAGRFYETPEDYLIAASGTFSRASDATYFDADGVLQTAGSNVLRLDHDPATGDPLGFRPEGQRTNLIPSSEALTGMIIGSGSKVDNAITAPDGTQTGARLQENGSEAQHNFVMRGVEYDTVLAASLFAQPDEWPNIRLWIGVSPKTGSTDRNIAGDTVNFTSAGFATTRTVLGDWNRLSISGEAAGTTTDRLFQVGLLTQSFAATASLGDGTGIYSWGWQAEPNSAFPSSYIKTSGSEVTRLADALSYAAPGSAAGTVVISARTPLGTGGNQVLWQWDDDSEDNRFRLVRGDDGDLHFIVTVEESDEVDLDLGAIANDTDFTVAVSWRAGEFHASVNGGTAVSDTSYAGSLPTVTTMREGSSSAGDEWFGTIARMVRYDKAYSAEQIEEMTA